MTCDHNSDTCSCPFAFTQTSEEVQNFGCLPTPHDIVNMRQIHGKTWACHSDETKPCVGAIRYMAENGMDVSVIDPQLMTEDQEWNLYVK